MLAMMLPKAMRAVKGIRCTEAATGDILFTTCRCWGRLMVMAFQGMLERRESLWDEIFSWSEIKVR
jgi:hypothetical protein